eukprot:CAMPEP_0202958714 /NCGR_PEP_ID=MMETSP1396-20130829/2985_1 /ASSEMBLY_ACC=CAM_ASM_000872 /TAXON_ID= /ORGANISM="Pseudokeronopsis sp., Strain Brazil" /LENGTH=118 /DNA_ID=CAMNT_0049676905 /DNA_START=951 /DNA_END=1307 /DNA_ORIENTATION=+
MVMLKDEAVFIRPFVKVGEPPENIKVLKYYLKFRTEIGEDLEDGPEYNRTSSLLTQSYQAEKKPNEPNPPRINTGQKVKNLFRNVFEGKPIFTTQPLIKHNKGQVEEVEFATTEWDNE